MSCESETHHLQIGQGKNWSEIFQWLSEVPTFRDIVSATQAAPCVIEVTAHGLKEGWFFTIEGCQGMTAINTSEPIMASVVDANHLRLSHVNAKHFDAYTGGGVIRYHEPVPLDGLGARMQLRDDSREELHKDLTVGGGQLVIDLDKRWVTAKLKPSETAALNVDPGVFDIEMFAGDDVPYYDSGTFEILRESSL